MILHVRRFNLYPRRVELLITVEGVDYSSWYDEPAGLGKGDRHRLMIKHAAKMAEQLKINGAEFHFTGETTPLS